MRISEFSKRSMLTKRTLQYYDELGLLVPNKLDNGYREYNLEHLKTVEIIKFLQLLDYSLKDISMMLSSDINRDELIDKQITYLKERVIELTEEINRLIKMKEGEFMDKPQEYLKEKYQKEVEERFGNSNEYKESNKRTKNYKQVDWDRIMSEQNDIYHRMSLESDITSSDVKKLVDEWQEFISRNFYQCSDEVLLGLADMYVSDHRFKENLNKVKDGFASFISEAIKYHKRG